MSQDIEDFITALPKVELHLHLVGSASLPTVLELARRHPEHGVPTNEADLRKLYQYKDFQQFASVYAAINSLVRSPEDIVTLVCATARELAAQNVRYVELTVTPYAHLLTGIPVRETTAALDAAAREAKNAYDIGISYIFDIWGDRGEPSAKVTLDAALTHPAERLVGFGLAGSEQGRAPHREVFKEAFRTAISAGLHSVPHAGEMSGPETIWTVIEDLHAERIGHGIACLADPKLVDYLRTHQIPLEVCPTSNVCTGQVTDFAAHPIRRLQEEGLYVTLNSDDPPMFGTTLTDEYRKLATVLGYTKAELAGLAMNGVRASFLPDAEKTQLCKEIDALLV